MPSRLYDADYNQWLEQTSQHLRARAFDAID